ncbi:MAG: molybdopterin-dependent oxidoreductase [Bacteroidetes bacterium]|nr:molybdopterin-dependent oxidoreductase [Bacteroidota bacterium]
MKETIQTACPRDCFEGCEIRAETENGRLIRMNGGPGNPYTRSIICQRVRNYADRVYDPGRITHPMKKVDGSWIRISWDEAIDLAAAALTEAIETYGPLSILSYQSAGSMSALKILNHRFFNLLGGVTTTWGSLCGGASSAARLKCTGAAVIQDPLDVIHTKGLILWGRNPIHTSIHLLPIMTDLRKKGVRVVMIDPIVSDSAKFADQVYQVRPNGDGYLALALARELISNGWIDRKFIRNHTEDYDKLMLVLREYETTDLAEKSGLTQGEIRELAEFYGKTNPCAIMMGFGVQRYVDGNEIVELIHALGALTGHISKAGGGVSHSTDEWRFFDTSLDAADQVVHHRKVSKSLLGIDLQREVNPPVTTAFIQLANPVNQTPNSESVIRAFKKMKSVILVDSFLTDTADVATLFLPTTTFVEEEDVMGSYGHPWLTYMHRVIPPAGESKTDLEILQLLAEKMGIQGMEGTVHTWIDRLLKPVQSQGINQKSLSDAGTLRTQEKPVPFEGGRFYTESGKFRFIRKYDAYEYASENAYPLFFMTVAGGKAHNSQIAESDQTGYPEAWVHPENLALSPVTDGMPATLVSRAGSLHITLRPDSRQRKDTLILYRGGWMKKGWGANAITEPLMSREGGGAAYYSTRVTLRKDHV